MARTVILGAGGHARALQSIRYGTLVANDDDVGPHDDVIIGVGDVVTRRKIYEKFEGRVLGVWFDRAGASSYSIVGTATQFMVKVPVASLKTALSQLGRSS